MSKKRFHSRRQWYNTVLMLWATPFLLLIGVILFAGTGNGSALWAIAGGCLFGMLVAMFRDLSDIGIYTLDEDRLILQARKDQEIIDLSDVMDASLIDRAGAREYIRSHIRKEGITGFLERHRAAKRFTRFTTVDIGLTSLTLGLGRRMIDRMPDARKDLVLLRLRNGRTHVLSPEYNQELISAVGRRTMSQITGQE